MTTDIAPSPDPAHQGRSGFSRRALLGAFGVGALTVAGAGAVARAATTEEAPPDGLRYEFYGAHQSGITTPMQKHLHFAALDVTTESRAELVSLLKEWTEAGAAMVTGAQIGEFGALGGPYEAPPEDTGEALDLPAAGLTITVGFGPTLFRTAKGVDRFGIADQKPATLTDLPHFPGDAIDPALSGGDICIQACADDAQVAVHAVRNLVRLAFGKATVKWSQMGFGKSSVTAKGEPTPRNLFGFKDGTANITADDQSGLDEFVWARPDDQPTWMHGGTYLAMRKIRMTIETWDRTSLREQEAVFGRTKKEGAPLSGGGEFDQPQFSAIGSDNAPLVAEDSHVALAHPTTNRGQKILRRGYNFADGSDALGRLDAGLFFLSFQRDLQRQFIPLQHRLSASDRMNEYVRYIANATFAVPPGVPAPGGYIGEGLFSQ